MSVRPDLNTDKGAHGYLPAYFDIASRIAPVKAVCEVGVFMGGSLELWQDMFPGAMIVGVDNDVDAHWPKGTKKIVSEQNDNNLPKQLARLAPDGYDLIVDDASHIAPLSRQTWELLWPLVRPGGHYVIEDWQIGFPCDAHYSSFGPFSVSMAKDFLDYLDKYMRNAIESIEYRHGLIIFRKTLTPVSTEPVRYMYQGG